MYNGGDPWIFNKAHSHPELGSNTTFYWEHSGAFKEYFNKPSLSGIPNNTKFLPDQISDANGELNISSGPKIVENSTSMSPEDKKKQYFDVMLYFDDEKSIIPNPNYSPIRVDLTDGAQQLISPHFTFNSYNENFYPGGELKRNLIYEVPANGGDTEIKVFFLKRSSLGKVHGTITNHKGAKPKSLKPMPS